jgi:alkylated DNA repair dioxygenase AlkB
VTAPDTDADPAEAAPAVRRGVSVERTWLDERSWVDVVRGWVDGADALYDTLVEVAPLRRGRLFRYDRWVEEPYLGAAYRLADEAPSPVLVDATKALRARYRVTFGGYSLVWYPTGASAMAFHRDREMRWLDDTLVALLVLGARRPLRLRPRANRYDHESPGKGTTHDVAAGHGDLVVMGGAVQAGWEHGVPPVAPTVGGRLSVQWRWTSRTGRPVEGASYRAPRFYDPGD